MFNRQSSQVLAASGRQPLVEQQDDGDGSTSCEDHDEKHANSCCECGNPTRRRRPRGKRPEQLRKELYELLLRRRVFLTDRLEKVEKMLLLYGVVTEKQIGNQAAEMLMKSAQEDFERSLTMRLEGTDYKSGAEDKRHTTSDGKLVLRLALRADFTCINRDDSWYELYKMYTNEKDLAEKDQ